MDPADTATGTPKIRLVASSIHVWGKVLLELLYSMQADLV